MAGAGYKLFNTGDVLTAAQVNTYLQEQAVMRFANSTARTTALSGVLAEGMMSYLDDTNSVEVYNGSAWVSVGSTGDITGVTAGTGISGGGASGDVTITNSMATAIDAKGDLIVGTGADTFSRLAVGGTNGHVLTVDSGEATGMKWAAPAGGSTFAGCSLYNSGNQTIGNSTWTALTFDSENFDSDGFHSTSSNTSRITIPSGKAGKYQFILRTQTTDNNTGARGLRLYKNGSDVLEYESSLSTRGSLSYQTVTVQNAIVGDYFEFFVYQTSGGNLTYSTTQKLTEFSASYLGA